MGEGSPDVVMRSPYNHQIMPTAPKGQASRSGGGSRSRSYDGSRRGSGGSRSRPPRPVEARRVLPPVPPPEAQAAASAAGAILLAAPLGVLMLGVVLLAIGLVVPGILVVLLALVVVLGGIFLARPARTLATLGGREAKPGENARLINVVEGLCVANGLSVPRLVVLDDPAANAIVLGISNDAATFVCTTGLLDLLDRMELEGLVAHELAHLKRGDTRSSGLAMSVLGLVALLLPHPSRLLRRIGDPRREVGADLLGASMTRYPPGLRQALEKLEAAPVIRPAALGARQARLTGAFWCAPLDQDPAVREQPGVFDLDLRASVLAEL